MRRLLATSQLLLMSVLIALGIGALVANQLAASRTALWREAQHTHTNLLFTVGYLVEHTLDTVDIALQHTVSVLGTLQEESIAEVAQERLFQTVHQDGYGAQLVLDHRGDPLRASRPIASQSFADRDYFLAHQQGQASELYISKPFVSRRDGELSIALSRKWFDAQGRFGGVVVQTIKLYVFDTVFSAIELGPDSGMNLFLEDGTIVMRVPYEPRIIGQSLQGTDNFERFKRERHGSFVGVAALDGVERLYSFRTVAPYPLLLNVAQSTDTVLGPWRRNALWMGVATVLLMISCLALAGLAERSLQEQRATARQLRRAERDVRTIMDSLPALVAYWDHDLVNRFANRQHSDWFGVDPAELQGKTLVELLGEDRFVPVQPFVEQVLDGHPQIFESRLTRSDGKQRYTVSTYIPDIGATGRVLGFFVLIHDISDRKRAEEALAAEKERFRITLESIKDGVVTTDAGGHITYQNPAASELTQWSLESVLHKPVQDVVKIETETSFDLNDEHVVYVALSGRERVRPATEHYLVNREGKRIPVEVSAVPIFDDAHEVIGAVLAFHDVTHARAQAQHMRHLAQHDALTGLPNRRFLDHWASQALVRAQRKQASLAVLYLDLDGFKQINDYYGHAAGDELLMVLARRLSAVLRAGDTLVRTGGDEFVVLMTEVRHIEDAVMLGERLLSSCAAPVTLSGGLVEVTASIGVSWFPDHGNTLEELLACADEAMYRAKQAGRNRVIVYQDTQTGQFMDA